MKILINLSIIQGGGGLQIAHSLFEELKEIEKHEYCFLISQNLKSVLKISSVLPTHFSINLISPSPSNIITGRRAINTIKAIEKQFKPDIVFTLFGPPYWKPAVLHVCGYALAQFIYKESPYFNHLPFKEKIILFIKEKVKMKSFKKHCDYFITETDDVSKRLAKRLSIPSNKIFTVSNTYNSIFNSPEKWKYKLTLSKISSSSFKLLTISSFYTHKNLTVIPQVIDYLVEKYPEFEFIFILSIDEYQLGLLTETHKKHILFLGKVLIEECPPLYQMADALFMPTLLECFTVSYLEAMKMNTPILTSDLPFAHDICQKAACYFNPLDPMEIGDKIVNLSNDIYLQNNLVLNGQLRVKDFGTAKDRAKEYISILEKLVITKQIS